MRIAFTGKAGSGKTTMANYLVKHFGFVRYSFADAVKEIAVELFNMEEKDRSLLQDIGTKLREIDADVWALYTLNKIEAEDHPNVVVDDCRFCNEAIMLKDNGFTIIKLTGRQKALTPEQAAHPSEKELENIGGDHFIDTSNSVTAVEELVGVVVELSLDVARSLKYFAKVEEKTNKNYVRGRTFEYRVMAALRRYGWHCMRRFGSKAEHIDGIGKVPTDLTAYKKGVYLIISCKYSILGPTAPVDDPDWKALVTYAERFDAVPVFAGVNSDRHVYLVDLRGWTPLDYTTKRGQAEAPDEKSMEELLKRAWDCMDIIIAEYKAAVEDPKMRVRWAGELVKMINVMTRLLWRAGATSTEDDLTTIMERAEEEMKKKNVT